MTEQEIIRLFLAVARLIFAIPIEKITSKSFHHPRASGYNGSKQIFGRAFSNGQIRAFDFNLDVGPVGYPQIKQVRMMEQNPNKTDSYGNLKTNALLARQGHRIVWIIRRNDDKWIGKIEVKQDDEGKDCSTYEKLGKVEPAITRVPGPFRGTVVKSKVVGTDSEGMYDMMKMTDESWKQVPEVNAADIPMFIQDAFNDNTYSEENVSDYIPEEELPF